MNIVSTTNLQQQYNVVVQKVMTLSAVVKSIDTEKFHLMKNRIKFKNANNLKHLIFKQYSTYGHTPLTSS